MSMENPFARKPAKQEEVKEDTSWVDLAERGTTAVESESVEVSGENESSSESNVAEGEQKFAQSEERLERNLSSFDFSSMKKEYIDSLERQVRDQWDQLVEAADKMVPFTSLGGVALTGTALLSGLEAGPAIVAGALTAASPIIARGFGAIAKWLGEIKIARERRT